MADTAALVVALSAQMTKFERDMKKAGALADDAVDDIEKKFSRMNPQVAASFLGNLFSNVATKAIDAAVAAVKELIDRFKELQNTAAYAGVSVEWLYGLQAVGEKAGASIQDINTAVKAVAFSLDEMARGGDNALKTLLAAPGNQQFLKGLNKDALTLEQTMKVVFDIMHNMSLLRAIDVGKNIGMPESAAIAAWKEGAGALTRTDEEAKKAAAALQKLQEVNEKFTAAMTAAWAAVKQFVVDEIIPGLKNSITDLIGWMEWLQKALKTGPLDLSNPIASLKDFEKRLNEFGGGNKPRVLITPGGSAEDPFARKTGTATNEYDRQSKQLAKHIATMEADTKSVAENVGVQEQMRVQAQLTTAAEQQFGVVTDETNAKIRQQAEDAGRAQLALAKAQHQFNEISAASKELGSALADAFKGAVLEGKKLNEVLSQLLKRLANRLIDKAFDMIFATPAGGGSSVFASLFKAEGGPVSGGRSYIVGERGPELFTPGVSGMVHPNNVLRNAGAGNGGAFNYAPAIDARGASVEAVARLAQILEQDRAAFASKTIGVIQQARRGRIPGL